MIRSSLLAASFILIAGSAASASPILQMDINSFNIQTRSGGDGGGAWGGIHHTGSLYFSQGAGSLEGLFSMSEIGGATSDLGFAGQMDAFDGRVDLNDGHVTGGYLSIHLTSGDSFSTNISSAQGSLSAFVGGGFMLDALTFGGQFSGSQFANADVSPWFGSQGDGGLPGSFLQFKFNPNANGVSTSDMDLFVDVVPLPAAAWTGLATIGGIGIARRLRRR